MLLFSHGLGGMKNQNSIQIEALVQQGYIIVAPDHAYDANITVFNDGTIADFRSGSEGIHTEDQFWEYRLPQLQTRTDDMNFIYNQAQSLSEKRQSIWTYVNIDKIGIFGHSFGGATSIMVAHTNPEIDAVFLLDAWTVPVPQSVVESGLNISFTSFSTFFILGILLNAEIFEKYTLGKAKIICKCFEITK